MFDPCHFCSGHDEGVRLLDNPEVVTRGGAPAILPNDEFPDE
ncbi:MAG: hypothetical protein P8N02_00740 [Actinomycetota bacterium]|nr:hypothetical protein [Actinomycetota bacterium]